MRDDDRRPPVQQPVERALDQHLGRPVDVRRRLVEDEDARVGEQRAGDRDQLALAGREARAALAHRVVEPAGDAGGDPVDADGRRRGRAPPSSVASGLPKRMFDAIVPLKRNGSWSTTPSWRRYERSFTLAEVDAVDAHRALVRVVEAADEPRERRLAAARLADEREAAAGRARGSRRPCSTGSLPYAKTTWSIARSPSMRGSSRASCRSRDLRLLVEDRRDLHHRGRARLELPVDVGELLQRLEHELEQVERGDQRADRDRVMRQQRVAGEEHGAGRDHAEELDRREEDREDLLRVDVLLAVRGVQLVELRLEARARG